MLFEKQPDGTFCAVIDDYEYFTETWGSKRGLEIGILLGAITSKPLEKLAQAIQQKNNGDPDQADELGLIAMVVAALFSSMGSHRADTMECIETLATYKLRRRKMGSDDDTIRPVGGMDFAYRGRLGHLRKVVQAAAEVQYQDFFGEIGAALAQARADFSKRKTPKAPPASSEPQAA